MFLEVTTLAEITTVNGTRIKPISSQGIRDINKCNHYQWPRSPSALSIRHWQIWRRALRNCFIDPMKTNTMELTMPLGPWEKDPEPTWTWFHSEEDNSLYKQEGLLWIEYCPVNLRRRRNRLRHYEMIPNTI